jgi:hypothetical protein
MSQKYAGEPSETRQTAKGCPKGSEAYQWGQENGLLILRVERAGIARSLPHRPGLAQLRHPVPLTVTFT